MSWYRRYSSSVSRHASRRASIVGCEVWPVSMWRFYVCFYAGLWSGPRQGGLVLRAAKCGPPQSVRMCSYKFMVWVTFAIFKREYAGVSLSLSLFSLCLHKTLTQSFSYAHVGTHEYIHTWCMSTPMKTISWRRSPAKRPLRSEVALPGSSVRWKSSKMRLTCTCTSTKDI